jgi:hypothetical protein
VHICLPTFIHIHTYSGDCRHTYTSPLLRTYSVHTDILRIVHTVYYIRAYMHIYSYPNAKLAPFLDSRYYSTEYIHALEKGYRVQIVHAYALRRRERIHFVHDTGMAGELRRRKREEKTPGRPVNKQQQKHNKKKKQKKREREREREIILYIFVHACPITICSRGSTSQFSTPSLSNPNVGRAASYSTQCGVHGLLSAPGTYRQHAVLDDAAIKRSSF